MSKIWIESDANKLNDFIHEHELFDKLDTLQNYDALKDAVRYYLDNDNLHMVSHISTAIADGFDWYSYDFSMGNMQDVTPLYDLEDLYDIYGEELAEDVAFSFAAVGCFYNDLLAEGVKNGELPYNKVLLDTAFECVNKVEHGTDIVFMLYNQGLNIRDALMNTIAGNVTFYEDIADLEAFKEEFGLTNLSDEEVLNSEDYMLTFENGNALNYVWHDCYTNEEFISAMETIQKEQSEPSHDEEER